MSNSGGSPINSRTTRKPLFSTSFLIVLLAISVITNVILLVKIGYPARLWHKVQIAFLPDPEIIATDHVRGDPGAEITVIEYSDFQCPFSARFHTGLRDLFETGEADVRWAYRHFPLENIHPMAVRAAEAAECAGDQGRFWDYADILFDAQKDLGDDLFFEIAGFLGLDMETFRECLESGKSRDKIRDHQKDGASMKITATPTFFVNGKRFEGAPTEEKLNQLILRKPDLPTGG